MELKVTPLTVRVVFPDLLPVTTDEVAVISDAPAVRAVARPLGLMVATPIVPDSQVTELVISTDVPSENMPTALNCWATPMGVVGFVGATVSEFKVTPLTVRSAVAARLPEATDEVAVITVWPAVTPVARPLASMVATPVVPDCQVTKLVRSADAPSENMPVALNCWVRPLGMLEVGGVIAIELKLTFLTVSGAVTDLTSVATAEVAVITVWPAAKPVARRRASMVATAVVSDCQETEVVISADVPSENMPNALNC